MNESDVVDYLSGISLRRFVEIVNGVAERYLDREEMQDGVVRIYSKFVIAKFSFESGDAAPELRFVASPSAGYEGAITDDLTQDGQCARCLSICTGFSKASLCPVCSEEVDMT